jgi:hypothetical protein
MKINGRIPNGPNRDVLVIPRPDGDFIFTAEAILDFTPFERLCKVPDAPEVITPNGKSRDTDDDRFKKSLEEYSRRRTSWMVINSLRPSNIEWDTVKFDEPDTWGNWEKDLEKAGFNDTECARIVQLIAEVNAISDIKLKEARERFLAGQQARQNLSSQVEEQ